jgi:hypothetical protein
VKDEKKRNNHDTNTAYNTPRLLGEVPEGQLSSVIVECEVKIGMVL